MGTIYIDSEFKCHSVNDGTMTAVETDFFDGKCPAFVEGYRFVPTGETWTREDGESFQPIGVPEYTRPGHGGPYNSATGGGQSMIEIAPDTFMITFYSADPVLPGRDHCYVDSCVFKLVR